MSFVNIIVLIISTFWISNSHSAVTDFKCTSSGYFRNPEDCTRFHVCVDLTGIRARGIFRKYNFNCPVGTVFDEHLSVLSHKKKLLSPKSWQIASGVGEQGRSLIIPRSK